MKKKVIIKELITCKLCEFIVFLILIIQFDSKFRENNSMKASGVKYEIITIKMILLIKKV